MTGNTLTLADIALLSALDVCELTQVDLSASPHINTWRKKLIGENFYQSCHENFAKCFDNAMSARK